jgi:hypothetical protein
VLAVHGEDRVDVITTVWFTSMLPAGFVEMDTVQEVASGTA